VSGFKVFTRQLDDIICEFPDVDLGASVGVPDPDRPGSEMVASAIVLKPGIEKSDEEKKKITEYLRGRVPPAAAPEDRPMDQLPSASEVLKRERAA
jgi:acyl-coenzyme A synthetase/AMP-(fatty) acid ligase